MMDASLWRPSASITILRQRAALIATIRQFFSQRNYLEVETPAMAHFGVSDVYLSTFKHFSPTTLCFANFS